ncbi:hypothetical protein LMG3412_05243 [Achromobacter deleyi]|nr:hypothetical protein LMG3412_05243 [Achromobacter deleyi]
MREDAAAGHEQQIVAAHRGPGRRHRAGPLARRERRHDGVVDAGGERRQAIARALDHFGIRLRELALQTVHVHVVHAGQAPERLVGLEADAQQGVARQRAIAVAMPVQRQGRTAAQGLDGRIPAPVQAGHYAGAFLARDQVGVAPHGVGFVGDVEGDHDLPPGALAVRAHDGHDGGHALRQRGVRGVGAHFVVLDEVHAGRAQLGNQVRGLLGRQADVGLDDGADQRALGYAGQLARAGNARQRHVELGAVVGRQFQLLQPQPGQLAQVVQIAADGGGQGRQVGADVGDWKGDAHARPAQWRRPRVRLAVKPGIGQAGRCGGRQRLDRFHLGAGARAQLVGFALHAGKGAAGLLARHDVGHAGRVQRGFDQVGGADQLGVHGAGRRSRRKAGITAGSGRERGAPGRGRPSPARWRGSGRTGGPWGRPPRKAR